jgi:hypothetical protein
VGRASYGRRVAEPQRPDERFDNPVERLRLLGGDDAAIESFLDTLDVQAPRAREMLAELARTRPLADPDAFPAAHRQAVAALESLGRHGYRGWASGRRLGPLRPVARVLVEVIARYLVVAYLRNVATSMRNLYWLRELQAPPETPERRLLRRARLDAVGLVEVFPRRGLGVPTFVFGGIAVPLAVSVGRLTTGALQSPAQAAIVGVVGAVIVVLVAQLVLSGTAMASRRIRLATAGPLKALWQAIGWARNPPRDQSRTFAIVAIVLTSLAWIVIPVAVGLALAR